MIPGAAFVAALVAEVPGLRPLAIGLATVELERAVATLNAQQPDLRFTPAADDELLGGRCLVAAVAADEGIGSRVVLLEPSTEGLLAASLARHGEGPAAVYGLLDADGPGERLLSTRAQGPLGWGRLVLGRSRFGPHVVILDQSG